MLTYQCGQCGRRFRSSHKPHRCGDCGGGRFLLLRPEDQLPAASSKGKPSPPSTLPPLPPAPFPAPTRKQSQKQRESNLDSIWILPNFSQIAGWSLGLLLLGGAFGYGLYRLGGGPFWPNLQIRGWGNEQKSGGLQGQDGSSRQATRPLPASGNPPRTLDPPQPQVPEPGTPAPGLALRRYYQALNQSDDGDRLDLAYRVEVYGEKILRADAAFAAVKLGLRYHLKNGETLCESRIFLLRRAPGPGGWQWESPREIRPQPQCKLN
ncbi:MAG: hypothetical protein GC158_03380 [Cyanobacteria bacterium RI_101]|nr:hypothetical protein [Cyanobacteria bacterium RI_101]